MTPSRTLRRLERVLTMVPWVLDHPGASIDELAERFGGSPQEILADLDVLGYCGLPGYGGGDLIEVRLQGDRVSVHMADYFRRPLRLTVREAVTLLLAARAFGEVAQEEAGGPLRRAAAKLESLLGTEGEGEPAVALELAATSPDHLPALRTALATGKVVRIVYRSESKAETTARDVEPWRLTVAGGQWYLQGWCRLANGPRDFRLDRIREVAMTPETTPAAPWAPDPPGYRAQPGDVQVVLDVSPEGRWITDWVLVDEVQPRGRRQRVTLRATTLDWAARLVLRLAGNARVVQPAELASRVRALASDTLACYHTGD